MKFAIVSILVVLAIVQGYTCCATCGCGCLPPPPPPPAPCCCYPSCPDPPVNEKYHFTVTKTNECQACPPAPKPCDPPAPQPCAPSCGYYVYAAAPYPCGCAPAPCACPQPSCCC